MTKMWLNFGLLMLGCIQIIKGKYGIYVSTRSTGFIRKMKKSATKAIELIKMVRKKPGKPDEFLGWLREYNTLSNYNPNDCNEAYCMYCHTSLRAHLADLKKHTFTKTHKLKTEGIQMAKKNSLLQFAKRDETVQQKTVDIKLSVHIACHSSTRSIDHLGQLLKDIGSETTTLKNLRLHHTKCNALITRVISPALLSELIKDIGEEKYSLILDESTDVSVNKYMALCVRYFSKQYGKVLTQFLSIIEVTQTTACDLFNALTGYLKKVSLPLKNLIAIATDGASNLCGKNHSLFTLLKKEVPGLILLKCSCHSINLAVSKASEELPASLDFLAREVYNWFSSSPLRKSQYRQLFDTINLNEEKSFRNFVQLSGTRWLSRYNVIKRILEHWLELKTFFNITCLKEKCYTARTINEMLADEKNQLYFVFLKPILYEMNKLSLTFQSNQIDLGSAYYEMFLLVQTMGQRIIKPIFLNTEDGTQILDKIIKCYENDLAFLSAEDSDLGYEFDAKISQSKIGPMEIQELKIRCHIFFKRLLRELVHRLPSHLNMFKNIGLLSSRNLNNKTSFLNLPITPFIDESDDKMVLESEWRKISFIDWSNILEKHHLENDMLFWCAVFNFRDNTSRQIFKELAEVVLRFFSLPVSNAEVERVFSIMNVVKIKRRNRMKLNTLESLLRIRLYNYSHNICCHKMTPAETMLNLFNSKEMYKHESDDNQESEENNLQDALHVIEEANITF